METNIKEVQKRGALTERVKRKAKQLLGYEIHNTELRLMPYIIHVMTNNQILDPRKLNHSDREIIDIWEKAGHISFGISRLSLTEEFWDIICEIVFLGYVDIDQIN